MIGIVKNFSFLLSFGIGDDESVSEWIKSKSRDFYFIYNIYTKYTLVCVWSAIVVLIIPFSCWALPMPGEVWAEGVQKVEI